MPGQSVPLLPDQLAPDLLFAARPCFPRRANGGTTHHDLHRTRPRLSRLRCGCSSPRPARLANPNRTPTVFLTATLLLALSAAVPSIDSLAMLSWILAVINFGAGMWIAMYLTMAQEVSSDHVSTAAGLLGGSGSLAGAVAMWAVGVVTKSTGSFDIPFTSVAVVAAVAGWAVTRATRVASFR